jgi:hypothetical protein
LERKKMNKYTSIRKFKTDLIKEMGSLDDEIIWDAVSSSEDHLNLMVEEILREMKDVCRKEAIHMAVRSFGYPSEIADVYRSFDLRNC